MDDLVRQLEAKSQQLAKAENQVKELGGDSSANHVDRLSAETDDKLLEFRSLIAPLALIRVA